MCLWIDRHGSQRLGFSAEVCGCLVVPAVFKTDVAEHLGQAGSIPVRLRQGPHTSLKRRGCYAATTAADRMTAQR